MRLRSLEIHGFKSFAERITFSFPAGITTIVGPNGCGKSNILDAVFWAIGERSARHLRGKVMEDVIFAGANGIKPVGMAEVNLVLANDGGVCPDRYKDLDEIMISRRLFRSGESEYAINKTPCRLRDVLDLFLDMGVSNQAYCIVEQGRIDSIIHAKPEEIRILIEEAAGIAKFRERKREALSKMEQTDQNLLRIQDVIGEIRRQIQSLQRQVRRAERFKSLRKEIRHIETAIAAAECHRLNSQLAEDENTLGRLKEDEESLSAQLQETEKAVKALKTQCTAWEERITNTERTIYEIKGTIDRDEGRIEAWNRELAGLNHLEVQYGEEIDELNARLRTAKEQHTTLEGELKDLEEKITTKEKELETSGAQWGAFQQHWDQAVHRLEEEKADLVDLLSGQSEKTNQISFCDRNLTELRDRKARNDHDLGETKANLEKSRASVHDRETAVEKLKASVQRCDEDMRIIGERIASKEDMLEKTESRVKESERQVQTARSKLRSLEDLQKTFEGFDEGVKTVMDLKHTALEGINAVVADIIETPPEYEVAVSAALAHRLQYVIVEDHTKGLEAVRLLKNQGGGRVGLIPIDLRTGHAPKQDPSGTAPRGVIASILDYVRFKDKYAHLGSMLLGDTWLVESLDQALQIWQGGEPFHCLVTREGEVLDKTGVITGGSQTGQAFHILERASTIRRLAEEVAQGESELRELQDRLEGARREHAEYKQRLDALTKEHQTLVVEQTASERDIATLRREVDTHEKRLKVLVFEQRQLETQSAQIEKERIEAEQELRDLEDQLKVKREAIEKAKTSLAELERQKDAMDREMTQLRVEIAGYREQRKGAHRNLDTLQEQQTDLRHQISKRLEILESNKKSIAKVKQDMEDVRGRIKDWKKKHDEARDRLTLEKQGLKEKSQELRKLEDVSRRDDHRLDEVRKKIHEKNLRLAETHLKVDHLAGSMREKYGIDLRVSLLSENDQPMQAPPDSAQLSRLKMSLDSLGEVNLVALQEYEDLKERSDFLTHQEGDLRTSLNRLRKAIQRIDRATKKRFLKAFEGTNEKFQTLFPRLFDGGKASLVLTDEEDILNTGVEIMAQLPGKKLKNLDLLSGGEKALVAIGLIFALFLHRPSPFCILDEVDAPLDDANVTKFLRLIQELSTYSQFIMITHNKKTMEIAHTLYGITVESPGVSKVVSVRLNEPETETPPESEKQLRVAAG